MGLGQALTSAVSGLRITQSGLSLIASNIANAETPGYVLSHCLFSTRVNLGQARTAEGVLL